jgi:hypothetical protein
MGAVAYSKAILMDTEEEEGSDNFSSSLRGIIIRRIYNLSDLEFVNNSSFIFVIQSMERKSCFKPLRAPYTLS